MADQQANSQFWGTGTDLTDLRDTLDPVRARVFLETISRRVFGDTFDYSLVEFRGVHLPIQLKVVATGEVFETTFYKHITSEDGKGEIR